MFFFVSLRLVFVCAVFLFYYRLFVVCLCFVCGLLVFCLRFIYCVFSLLRPLLKNMSCFLVFLRVFCLKWGFCECGKWYLNNVLFIKICFEHIWIFSVFLAEIFQKKNFTRFWLSQLCKQTIFRSQIAI